MLCRVWGDTASWPVWIEARRPHRLIRGRKQDWLQKVPSLCASGEQRAAHSPCTPGAQVSRALPHSAAPQIKERDSGKLIKELGAHA